MDLNYKQNEIGPRVDLVVGEHSKILCVSHIKKIMLWNQECLNFSYCDYSIIEKFAGEKSTLLWALKH